MSTQARIERRMTKALCIDRNGHDIGMVQGSRQDITQEQLESKLTPDATGEYFMACRKCGTPVEKLAKFAVKNVVEG